MTLLDQFSELEGLFRDQHLTELQAIEEALVFPQLTSQDALRLGQLIVEKAQNFGEEPAIIIERVADGATIFQYLGNSCSQRNLNFALAKMEAVKRTGHTSLWGLIRHLLMGDCSELFIDDRTCLPVAGAFPLRVNGQVTAIIGISGLHNGNDHRLLMASLSAFLNLAIPVYTGPII